MINQNIINKIMLHHFNQKPKAIKRITIGICNEVYCVSLNGIEVIVRLSSTSKYLRGSAAHIPKFKNLGIKVPTILAEDYSQNRISFCYQIQNKIEGKDLGLVIESLTNAQLVALAYEIAVVFKKVKTLPVTKQFGVIWGGDDDVSDSWSERMRLWVDESIERGQKTGVMDKEMETIVNQLYIDYKPYFDSLKPIMYYGDICSKNVMIENGVFNGLVDLDGLTQGDPLEAIGRIFLSWFNTSYGKIYTDAIMDELALNEQQRRLVIVYALLNQMSWACENGIQFNQNTRPIVDWDKAKKDKNLIIKLAAALELR